MQFEGWVVVRFLNLFLQFSSHFLYIGYFVTIYQIFRSKLAVVDGESPKPYIGHNYLDIMNIYQ